MGNFAPHEKKGITRIVATRSFSSDSVRVFIMAGTLHPNPMIMGMNDRPDSPNRLKILSSTNAMRAIYPVSSRTENHINNISICGRKPSTANSPPSTPSATNPDSHCAPIAPPIAS